MVFYISGKLVYTSFDRLALCADSTGGVHASGCFVAIIHNISARLSHTESIRDFCPISHCWWSHATCSLPMTSNFSHNQFTSNNNAFNGVVLLHLDLHICHYNLSSSNGFTRSFEGWLSDGIRLPRQATQDIPLTATKLPLPRLHSCIHSCHSYPASKVILA